MCLSSNYDGEPFSYCYAIDPITGKELDIEIHLDLTPQDIAETYSSKKVDYDKTKAAMGDLMEYYVKKSRNDALTDAIDDAVEYAFANCGVQPEERLSDKQVANITRLLLERLEPFIIHHFSDRRFGSNG